MRSESRRRFLASASAVAVAGSLPASGSAQTAINLRFSSSLVADQNSAHYIWYQRFESNLKAAIGERIKLDYFPNNQLGKEADVVQQVKVGSIDMMVTGSSIWATVAPEFGMLDLGYVFDSYTHVAKALDGGVGASLNNILQGKTGCNVLAWASHFGARSVYTKAQVRSLAEVKGVKLRVLPTPAFIETFKIMGAIPTPIPFGELYTAAQTGVVDGFEHDAATVLSSKLNEVVKFCWLTEHLFSPMIVVIGKRGMDKIPADLRPAFQKAAQEATANQRAVAAEKGAQAIDALKKLGLVFNPMAKAERDGLRKEMEAKLWATFAKEQPVTKPLFGAISKARA
ncbi:MAG TPA: TRAP transporter substrate-binding protein [Burkholderiales bacterium]|jgi:tripartite ATP-independent transporter DctP family solute receptor|nr:TRAP transporter substrate-binding protein [Burkholderiales bacterium]